MYRVPNRKIIRTLSNRSFLSNRTRNGIAVLAIALTALLFTALFTIGSGLIENIQRQTMRQAGGDGMGVLKYITDDIYEDVKDHPLIKDISYNRILSSSVDNEELLKRHGELYYMDEVGIRLGFCEPIEGTTPKAEDDLMMDTRTAALLGVELKVGTPVSLILTVHGEQVTRQFKLCGWWEADPVFQVSILVASRAYVDAHQDELYNSYYTDSDLTGAINCYIMFHNSLGLEKKLSRVITESGYSQEDGAPGFIASNVNWSYLSTGLDVDAGTVTGVSLALLLIGFAGYLIIYNIFQISVIRDIRFYGLLKTIGTTGRQIKGMIRKQAFYLSVMGIPLGLLAGYLTGIALIPMIMEPSFYVADHYKVSANPLIFIGSTLFALATVWISTAKPGKIAAKVSPVEAVRYIDPDCRIRRRKRRLPHSAKIYRMAAANLSRNRKRTILVILSMSLSLVLFNTVYTFSLGFNMDKFLSKFVDTDFLIAHADYFNYRYSGPEDSLSESMIAAVEEYPGFLEGGRLYANIRGAECFTTQLEASDHTTDPVSELTGGVFSSVYGLEDLPLSHLEVVEGSIDWEKLKSGAYILEGVQETDKGELLWETSHREIGEKVTLSNFKGTGESMTDNERKDYEFEVMAKVRIKYYTNSCMVHYDYSWYLPANVYLDMVSVPGTMSYAFNVSEGSETSMEAFLKDYTVSSEPEMNYSSKATRASEFSGMKDMILVVGGALSLLIGLIGVLNFINSILTSIITRRREFAMLQSIGMTKTQLLTMLMIEGLYYSLASGLVSLILGILLSLLVVRSLIDVLWFFSYHFTILPLLLVIPLLVAIGILLPAVVLRSVEKQSIVERIRED